MKNKSPEPDKLKKKILANQHSYVKLTEKNAEQRKKQQSRKLTEKTDGTWYHCLDVSVSLYWQYDLREP